MTDAGFESLLTAQGEVAATTLTELELAAPSRTPFTLHRQAVPFDDGPTLVGVDYDRSVPDVLRVYLHWQGPAEGAWQAQVRTADGVEGVASLPSIPRGTYQTVVVDLGFVDGPLRLTLTNVQGEQTRVAGPWGWTVQELLLPAPADDARFVPLGDEMAVIGAKAHPAGPGETMAVDVTLVTLRPLTSDDGTSVRLKAADGRWLDTHDSQPALGAVPTLKWIRGSRVVDRHLLQIPDDFAGGQVRATLVAYERFRTAPLPSMDGRFAQVPLGTWPLP